MTLSRTVDRAARLALDEDTWLNEVISEAAPTFLRAYLFL